MSGALWESFDTSPSAVHEWRWKDQAPTHSTCRGLVHDQSVRLMQWCSCAMLCCLGAELAADRRGPLVHIVLALCSDSRQPNVESVVMSRKWAGGSYRRPGLDVPRLELKVERLRKPQVKLLSHPKHPTAEGWGVSVPSAIRGFWLDRGLHHDHDARPGTRATP